MGNDARNHDQTDEQPAPIAGSDRGTTPPARPPTVPPWITGNATTEELIAYAESAVGDRYRIETIAGRGGMGRVFAARDTELARPVAIKLLTLPPPDRADEPFDSRADRATDRLQAEARAIAALDHPNLCGIVEVALDRRVPFLVMRWANGEPLDRVASRLTAKARVTLLLRVIDAAAAMHETGLAHGDLKPANILVDKNNSPTIVDFGLARAESDSAPPALGGSPGYAAPEQLLSTGPIGPEADVFALGVLLYELLTGRSPFPRNTAPAVFAGLLERGALRLPDEIAEDTPADLQKICLAAMEHDPKRRYRDAGALAADIRRYLRRETVAARPSLLTSRLRDDVEDQIEKTREWHRLGMITRRDAENAARVLRALPHAESPWIVDARRLRGSQFALVVGGWVLILAIAVALSKAAIPTAVAVSIAWSTALAPLVLGLRLHRTGQKRLGLGMLLTAQLAIPAAAWLTLQTTGWLTGFQRGATSAPAWSLRSLYAGEPTLIPVIADSHAVIVTGIAALLATALLLFTRRTVFSLALTTSLALHWPLALLMTRGVREEGLAALRDHLVPLGLPVLLSIIPIVAIQIRSTDSTVNAPTMRQTNRTIALANMFAILIGGLAIIAIIAPGIYLGRPSAEATPDLIAYAFLINAVIITAACIPSFRGRAFISRRVSAAARWVLPIHLMLPLVFMDIHQTFGVRTPWLVALLLASIGFTTASALQQWRPFLFSGLAFLAVWFVRATDALGPAGDAVLAAVSLLLGLGLLVAAWRAPAYLAKRRLEKWTRAADARPDPRARRTWR